MEVNIFLMFYSLHRTYLNIFTIFGSAHTFLHKTKHKSISNIKEKENTPEAGPLTEPTGRSNSSAYQQAHARVLPLPSLSVGGLRVGPSRQLRLLPRVSVGGSDSAPPFASEVPP